MAEAAKGGDHSVKRIKEGRWVSELGGRDMGVCVGGGRGEGWGHPCLGPPERSPPNPLQSGHHGGGGGDRESQGVHPAARHLPLGPPSRMRLPPPPPQHTRQGHPGTAPAGGESKGGDDGGGKGVGEAHPVCKAGKGEGRSGGGGGGGSAAEVAARRGRAASTEVPPPNYHQYNRQQLCGGGSWGGEEGHTAERRRGAHDGGGGGGGPSSWKPQGRR